MRPRKTVLLHCVDDQRCSEIKFLLTTQGFNVSTRVSSPGRFAPQCALVQDDISLGSEQFAEFVDKEIPDCRILVMCQMARRKKGTYPATARRISDRLPAIELLDWVRLATQRKRGPKLRREVLNAS
jgi:hypothetical protein